MKKQILTMFTGLFIGAIITGGASAYAAGILAERSNHRIFVDGQEVQMEAYGIAGHNYVKLRDIGKAVGFNVFWDADSGYVQIETGAPYTGEAPSAETVPSAAAPSDVDAAKQDMRRHLCRDGHHHTGRGCGSSLCSFDRGIYRCAAAHSGDDPSEQ